MRSRKNELILISKYVPMFKIGEKVRMLHDIHEGVVLKVKDRGIIEIETTEGFVIPVLERELVKIHGMETPAPVSPKQEKAFVKTRERFGLGVEKISIDRYRLYLINETSNSFVGTVNFKKQGSFYNHSSFSVDAMESKQILGQFEMSSFELWNRIQLQLLPFQEEKEAKKWIQTELVLKAPKLLDTENLIPIVKKAGFYVEIDITDQKIEPSEETKTELSKSILNELVIDLHAEKLGLKSETLDFLDLQYKEFLKAFDRCVHEEIPKLIVVHGVGKGILKNTIHQFLAGNEQINHFRDAHKEKFGYGATEILFN